MKNIFFRFVVIASLLLQVAMGTSIALASPLQEPIIVTHVIYPNDLQGWGFFTFDGSGTNSFMTGPGTPPLGAGSVQLQITGVADDYLLYTLAWSSQTPLNNITTLSYSTYHDPSSSGSLTQLPALVIAVDYNLSDDDSSWQGTVVYEPYRTPSNVPAKGAWQTWNTLDGYWWATDAPGNETCPQSSPCTWIELIAAYPNIGVTGVLGFEVGGGWENGFIGNVDNFSIGKSEITIIYDFEYRISSVFLPLIRH